MSCEALAFSHFGLAHSKGGDVNLIDLTLLARKIYSGVEWILVINSESDFCSVWDISNPNRYVAMIIHRFYRVQSE